MEEGLEQGRPSFAHSNSSTEISSKRTRPERSWRPSGIGKRTTATTAMTKRTHHRIALSSIHLSSLRSHPTSLKVFSTASSDSTFNRLHVKFCIAPCPWLCIQVHLRDRNVVLAILSHTCVPIPTVRCRSKISITPHFMNPAAPLLRTFVYTITLHSTSTWPRKSKCGDFQLGYLGRASRSSAD